ncbi:MAG: IPExxxVDY family protein [Flavobacteriaceae bacterium]|nr:IPExxxVDY family protein [Flavobacteriaceae bacterium]
MGKKIIHIIDWDDDDSVFDFLLLGLQSTLAKDYSLVFAVNTHCKSTFTRAKDQKITADGVNYTFSVFRFHDQKTKQTVELISNYSHPKIIKTNDLDLFGEAEQVKILIPEFRMFNFFIKSAFPLDQNFCVTLRKLSIIKQSQEIDNKKISKNNLENLILPK